MSNVRYVSDTTSDQMRACMCAKQALAGSQCIQWRHSAAALYNVKYSSAFGIWIELVCSNSIHCFEPVNNKIFSE